MLNFSVGPVQAEKYILDIGAEQVPYFRTPEFSKLMTENERLIKKFAKADENARVIFLTGSGTAAMEASVMNTLSFQDKVLIVNGGSFGKRFVQLCELHGVPYTEIRPQMGFGITEDQLANFDRKGYTAFLVNMHETSTGVLYDMNIIGEFCKRNNLFLIVDAISSFLADPIEMREKGIDVLLTGSQKALACPPGISIVVLSPNAIKRVNVLPIKSMYFDFKDALINGERGQTPFTPAVSILIQINARLNMIEMQGGIESEIGRVRTVALDFRHKIADLPFEITSNSLSNAVTPLHPLHGAAYKIFEVLKDEYGIWICPNGGEQKDKIFRVGHLGALTEQDNDKLIDAFRALQCEGIL